MYTVLFDIDGTLVQTGGAGKQAFAEIFRELFAIADISAEVGFAGRSDRAIAEDLMRHHGIAVSPENWQRFCSAYVERLGQVLPQCQGEVLPGVIELLDQLEHLEHVTVGLLTGNIALGARAKLGYFKLFDRFEFGGFGDECVDRNDIARAALEATTEHWQRRTNGTATDRRGVMVVGDTPADIRCARAIHAFAVAVATGGASFDELEAEEPDLLLPDLRDPEPVLAQVSAALA